MRSVNAPNDGSPSSEGTPSALSEASSERIPAVAASSVPIG
jgi:hypothetical protein